MAYYNNFIDTFPDIFTLAEADIDQVLKLWEGLGYYSRARNLHAAAKYIVTQCQGRFPEKYEDILELRGVGPYAAAAIASLAFDYPAAAVDGNVIRVISRIFAIQHDARLNPGKKEINNLAESLLDRNNPGEHNQAMIELGALICIPKNPKCEVCPVNHYCKSFSEGIVNELPVRYAKPPSGKRFFVYYVILSGENIFIQKRAKKDIWQSLYEFPLYEPAGPVSESEMIKILTSEWKLSPGKMVIKNISPVIKHVLSHQHIYARFIHVIYKGRIQNPEWQTVTIDDLHLFAFPALISKYIRGGLDR